MDLFIIGTETTAGTLKWLLLYLIHNPDIQQKCQNEIHEVNILKIISHGKGSYKQLYSPNCSLNFLH